MFLVQLFTIELASIVPGVLAKPVRVDKLNRELMFTCGNC